MNPRATLDALKTTGLIIRDLPDRAILISGRDVESWLQGQITQDLRKLAQQQYLSTCFCKPTGQIRALAHIYPDSKGLILITDQPDIVLDIVSEFVILEDVEAQLYPSRLQSVQGAGIGWPDIDVPRFPRDRTGFGGFDVFEGFATGLATLESATLEWLEIAAGIPHSGVDYSLRTLPPELGPHFDREYVAYDKGCYTGQEVLQRIRSRGHTNRTWVGLRLEQTVSRGVTVRFQDQVVGEIQRSAVHPELGVIGTATLRNEATHSGTELDCGGVRGVVDSFPLSKLSSAG